MKTLENYKEVRGLLAVLVSAGIAVMPAPNGNVMDVPRPVMEGYIVTETEEKANNKKGSKTKNFILERKQTHYGLNLNSNQRIEDRKFINRNTLNEIHQMSLWEQKGKAKALQRQLDKKRARALR